jgi:hypothetical protein
METPVEIFLEQLQLHSSSHFAVYSERWTGSSFGLSLEPPWPRCRFAPSRSVRTRDTRDWHGSLHHWRCSQLAIRTHFPCAHRGQNRGRPAHPSDPRPRCTLRPSAVRSATSTGAEPRRGLLAVCPGRSLRKPQAWTPLRRGHPQPSVPSDIFLSLFPACTARGRAENDVTRSVKSRGSRLQRVRAPVHPQLFVSGFGLQLARAVSSFWTLPSPSCCVQDCD